MAARLPGLDPLARAALALVSLAGRTPAEAAVRVGVSDDELAAALARARKELRRSVEPLPGSGWCERAERLISDRLDAELDDVGYARLDVHLRNCPRCVDHERRLVQALDALVAGVAGEREAPTAPAAAPLRLAEHRAAREPSPARPPIAVRPFGVPVTPAAAQPAPVPEPAPGAPAAVPAPVAEPAPGAPAAVPAPVAKPGPVAEPAQPAPAEELVARPGVLVTLFTLVTMALAAWAALDFPL